MKVDGVNTPRGKELRFLREKLARARTQGDQAAQMEIQKRINRVRYELRAAGVFALRCAPRDRRRRLVNVNK